MVELEAQPEQQPPLEQTRGEVRVTGPAAHGPVVSGQYTRERIERTNDYQQAGERYLLQEEWEREELVKNFVDLLSECDRPIQERMVWHLFMCEDEYGARVGDGLGISADDVRGLEPLATQTLTDEELRRAANLGDNGTRETNGLVMTHCVPNEHDAKVEYA